MEAVAVRQDQVHHAQGELPGLHPEHGADGIPRRFHVIALALEGQTQILGDHRFVVDHQDARLHEALPINMAITSLA